MLLCVGCITNQQKAYSSRNSIPKVEAQKIEDLPISTKIYTQEQIDFLLEHVETEKTWPTIHMVLNDFERSSRFFDFEVKATTNNFKSLVYYYLSTNTNSIPPYSGYNFIDKGAVVLYNNTEYIHTTQWNEDFLPGYADGRIFLLKHDYASIYDSVANPSLAYITTCELIVSTNQYAVIDGKETLLDVSWMNDNNQNLKWVFTRITPTDMERISQNTHPFYSTFPIWTQDRRKWDDCVYELDNPRN